LKQGESNRKTEQTRAKVSKKEQEGASTNRNELLQPRSATRSNGGGKRHYKK